jgi:citrate lyase beta subunit
VSALAAARSLLFTPAGDARKADKALAGAADLVVLDLEDAIAPSRKDEARRWLAGYLAASPPRTHLAVWIRINAPDTPWGAADLAAVAALPVAGLVLPKASLQALDAIATVPPPGQAPPDKAPPGKALPVIALIETARGLREAYQVAAHDQVAALLLGGADLGAELGWIPRPDGLELLHARSSLVVDSAAAGIRPPFDVVRIDYRDTGGLIAEAAQARSLGFGGKACIHPDQVGPVNEAFSPSREELEAARGIVAAFETAARQGHGVAVAGGQMIDQPVVGRARALLASAEPVLDCS